MANIYQASPKRLTVGLTAVSFAIGYFGAEFFPTLGLLGSVSTAQASAMNMVFGIAQVLSLLCLGLLTDHKRPLLPLKIAAVVFVAAALIGFVNDPNSLFLDRLLVGVGAGAIGSLYRAAGRLTSATKNRAKQMNKLINWPATFGAAFGTILPVLGWQWLGGGDGRAILNTVVALFTCLLALRLPAGDAANEPKPEHAKPPLPIIVLCSMSFFTTGAYAVFFLIVSNELIPSLPVSQLWTWALTALIYFVGGATGWWMNNRKSNGRKDSHALALVLLLCGFAYTLPALAHNALASYGLAIVMGAQLLAIVFGAFADSFWGSLVSRSSNPRYEGAIFGLTLTVGAVGRMFWSGLMSRVIGQTINWQQALLFALATTCIGALIIVKNSRILETQNDRA